MKAYFILLGVLIFLSIAPLLGLKIYINQTGDYEARWLIIRFLYLQLIIWILCFSTLIYGAFLVLSKRLKKRQTEN